MTADLLSLWGIALILLALATVASLLPSSRRHHRVGIAVVWAVFAAGAVGVGVATWSQATVGEDELYDAGQSVSRELAGVPGKLQPARVAAAIEAELGHELSTRVALAADPFDSAFTLGAGDGDSAEVCVTISTSAGTSTSVQSSSLSVDTQLCDRCTW